MILGVDGRLANRAQAAGAGQYCREVIRALAALEEGPALRIYLDEAPKAAFPPMPTSAEIRVLPPSRGWTHLRLAGALRRDPPDVFYSPLAQLPFGCPCPSIVTVLDLAAWRHAGTFPGLKWLTMRAQAEHAIRRADRLIAISEATAKDLADFCGVGAPRVRVAHPGCVPQFFEPVKPGPGTLLDKLPERYVLYLGQVQPRKNLRRLIYAFGRACAEHPDLPHHLLLAGGLGWMQDDIRRAAVESAQATRIHFLDYVPDSLVPALVARADVLALVSLWEGFGLPALEAMAAGTAVLASNTSSLPEVVGDAGVLVDPEDVGAIARGLGELLKNDALRATCEQRGRQRARGFTWDTTARVIAQCADDLCGGTGR